MRDDLWDLPDCTWCKARNSAVYNWCAELSLCFKCLQEFDEKGHDSLERKEW